VLGTSCRVPARALVRLARNGAGGPFAERYLAGYCYCIGKAINNRIRLPLSTIAQLVPTGFSSMRRGLPSG